jgi:dihydropteroate synthase
MAGAIADHGGSGIIMASRDRPGDLLTVDDIISVLAERMGRALEAGIPPERIAVDPGVGRWVPKKAPEYDLAILDGLRRLRTLGRPVMAALSRKSFIGARLDKPDPSQRLCGSLAATAIAVYNGAHIVRTHDVSASLDVIRMAQAARPLPPRAEEGEVAVEVWEFLGREVDLLPSLRRRGVDEEGARILCRKGSFRVLEVSGINSMEAIIIKQEMLARGGDAAIPRLALRCHPGPMRVVIFGTASQLSGLARKLKGQPFNLPAVGSVIESALDSIGEPGRYR